MFKRLFARSSSFFSQTQNSILSAASVIMVTVALSSFLGVLRERLMYSYFQPETVGIYIAAFRLPNLLFDLLVVGAVSTAFIPIFSNYLVKGNRESTYLFASYLINASSVVIGALTVIAFVFAWQLSYVLVPGFSETERQLMVSLTRIMLIGQLLPLVIGNFTTGILQSYRHFLVPALSPIMYNIGIIAGIIFLSPLYGLYGPTIGVVFGAFLFLLIQLPLLVKIGYKHTFRINFRDAGVRAVGKLMLPRTFGLAISQIDTTVDLILASLLGARNIAIFHSAQKLQFFPISLFGNTFSQAALPVFSTEAAKNDMESFKKLLLASMHQILFFVVPLSVVLAVLRTPIVRLAYGAEKFDWPATVATGQTLSLFAISIFAQSLIQLFARAFYAMHDTKTPVLIGIVSVVCNTALSTLFILYLHLPVWALALSASTASIVNVVLLFIFLYKRVHGFNTKALLFPIAKIFVASLATGICLYIPIKLFDQLIFDTTRVVDLVILTGIATFSGLAVYIFLAWFLDIEEVSTFFKLLHRVKRMQHVFFTSSQELVNGDETTVS